MMLNATMVAEGLLTDKGDKTLRAELQAEINAAVAEAEAMPNPALKTMFEDVYADEPATSATSARNTKQRWPPPAGRIARHRARGNDGSRR